MNKRDQLRQKQDRIITIATSRGFPLDVPVSDLQFGCPTVNELKPCLHFTFEASFDSFLAEYDKP